MLRTREFLAQARRAALENNGDLPQDYRGELADEAERVHTMCPRASGRGRNVVLIGGGGYIGPVVAAALAGHGYRVHILDNFIYGHEGAVYGLMGRPDVCISRIDLTDLDRLHRAMSAATDVVILGGLVGDPITRKFPDESEQINGTGTRALIDSLNGLGLNKVVFVSTCSNYGLIGSDVLAGEEFALNPLSLYAKAKVAAERHLIEQSEGGDYAPVILRFATAFGLAPRMRFDLTVNDFAREIAVGNPLVVYDADTSRPYCHVQDFAVAIRRVLEAPVARVRGEVFNVGGDANNFTKRMIVEAILERLPEGDVAYRGQGSDPRNYRVSFAKIRERLYFEPRRSVADGIDEVLAAVRGGFYRRLDGDPNYYGNYALVAWPPRKG